MNTFRQILLFCLVCLWIIPTIAQDLDETYIWEDDGVSIDYPDDWAVSIDDNDYAHFASDDTDMFILFQSYDADDDLEEYVSEAFDSFRFDTSIRFDEDDVIIGELEDFERTASYFYDENLNGDEFQRAIFAIPLNDETIAIAVAVPISDDEIEELDTVLDMLATLAADDDNASSSAVSDDDYDWDNGYSIDIFGNWEEEDELFNNGRMSVRFFFYEVEDERFDNRATFLRQTFLDQRIDDVDFNEDFIVFTQIDNDNAALAYSYDEDDGDRRYTPVLVSFTTDDDVVVVAFVLPIVDNGDVVIDEVDDLYDFLNTFE